ncbi:hypothetical protein HGB25_02285 [Candidatus Saccharibacteria bacterium]|nr:hypothetical protein [Candidatus Saccharibacteria bacterium]
MVPIFHTSCPDYNFSNLDLEKVSKVIDDVLMDSFLGKEVVTRGVQSEKHNIEKSELIKLIAEKGTDRYSVDSENQIKVSDRPIDLFGYSCKVEGKNICLPVLEGFHKWKPMCLEVPQRKVDLWMVYDRHQLQNVHYNHGHYGVVAKDGYLFKDQNNKAKSLIGIIVLD